MNPIENLWGILARRVYANGRQFGNAEALKQEIVNEWSKIDQDTLKTLIESKPDRIFSLATKTGVPQSIRPCFGYLGPFLCYINKTRLNEFRIDF